MKANIVRTLLLTSAFTVAALLSNPTSAQAGPRHSQSGLGKVATIFTKLGTKGNAKSTYYKMHMRKKHEPRGQGAGFKRKRISICAAYGNN